MKKARKAVINQMVILATNSFGLIAALAWNNVIQEAVNTYVKPYISQGSGLISLILYAVTVTTVAVLVTLKLTELKRKI